MCNAFSHWRTTYSAMDWKRMLVSLNHLRPSAAYMRQWTGAALLQVMACRHYLNQCWFIVNWTLGNKHHRNLNQDTKLFIHENVFEIVVWEMAAILLRGRWVNSLFHEFTYLPHLVPIDLFFCNLVQMQPEVWCRNWNILVKIGQYYGYWWPGSLWHQVISSHDIDFAG